MQTSSILTALLNSAASWLELLSSAPMLVYSLEPGFALILLVQLGWFEVFKRGTHTHPTT